MKTVLVIDDDPVVRAHHAGSVVRAGWRAIETDNGEAGLAMAKAHHPSVILCDLFMPRLNGFQVCRALREDPSLREIKIIVISGRGFAANEQAALEAGANKFLIKPINPRELVQLIEELTGPPSGTEHSSAPPLALDQATTLKFWGVRGSIPTPGPATVFYGGNTSCVEIRADGELIILDAGTGIRPLGLELVREFKGRPLRVTILISHTHWDHIQGFPFFTPAYNPENHLRILGYQGARDGLARILSGQMEGPYFPIGLKKLPGHIVIEELKDMDFAVGKVQVQALYVKHPGVCVGYRLNTSRGSIAYLPDNEPHLSQAARLASGRPRKEGETDFNRAEDDKLAEFIRDVDALIIDSQYDATEYPAHRDWGHGCLDDVVALALRAGVNRLYLFHHDPEHNDEKITQMVEHARKLATAQGSKLVIEAAREGEQLQLTESFRH